MGFLPSVEEWTSGPLGFSWYWSSYSGSSLCLCPRAISLAAGFSSRFHYNLPRVGSSRSPFPAGRSLCPESVQVRAPPRRGRGTSGDIGRSTGLSVKSRTS